MQELPYFISAIISAGYVQQNTDRASIGPFNSLLSQLCERILHNFLVIRVLPRKRDPPSTNRGNGSDRVQELKDAEIDC